MSRLVFGGASSEPAYRQYENMQRYPRDDDGKPLSPDSPKVESYVRKTLRMRRKISSGPRLIILVGAPGCGKSFISAQLMNVTLEAGRWLVVNQDTLGSRKACYARASRHLQDNRNRVVIDRCNFDRQQRQTWVQLAKNYGIGRADIWAIELHVPLEVCIERVNHRVNHPTLKPGKKSANIVRGFSRLLEWVNSSAEGIGRVLPSFKPDDVRFIVEEVRRAVSPPGPMNRYNGTVVEAGEQQGNSSTREGRLPRRSISPINLFLPDVTVAKTESSGTS